MAIPRESTERPAAAIARLVLSGVVLIQSAGLILTTSKEGTAVGTWLFLDRLWAEAATKQFEWAGTLLAAVASVALVFARRSAVRWASATLVAGWCLALALFQWKNGGSAFSELSVPAHATRFAAPLALAALDRKYAAVWLLRVGIALTFFTHGLEAFRLHPGFIDYLIAADRNIFGLGLNQSGAEVILRVIAIHDFVLAGFVLVGGRNRFLLGWMAFWGVVTSLSRVVLGGEAAAYLAIVRIANGGLPLVLLLLTRRFSMSSSNSRLVGRLARAVLPIVFFLLPMAAGAQAAVDPGTSGSS